MDQELRKATKKRGLRNVFAALILVTIFGCLLPASSQPASKPDAATQKKEPQKPSINASFRLESILVSLTFVANGVLALLFAVLQFRETRRIGERQLRAYIVVESGLVLIDHPNRGDVTAVLRLKNSGVTPGYKVRGCSGFVITDTTYDPSDMVGEAISDTIVGPSGLIDQSIPKQVTPEQFVAIKDRSYCFFVWGKFEYTDIFGKPRFLSYKYRTNGPDGAVLVDGGTLQGWVLKSLKDGVNAD